MIGITIMIQRLLPQYEDLMKDYITGTTNTLMTQYIHSLYTETTFEYIEHTQHMIE